MKQSLIEAKQIAEADSHLSDFDIHIEGNELRLTKKGESFTRLIPKEKNGQWRMEYFLNRERWEHIEFSGTLKECLTFLSENPHYLFWNR